MVEKEWIAYLIYLLSTTMVLEQPLALHGSANYLRVCPLMWVKTNKLLGIYVCICICMYVTGITNLGKLREVLSKLTVIKVARPWYSI